jgi:hypothetical protein
MEHSEISGSHVTRSPAGEAGPHVRAEGTTAAQVAGDGGELRTQLIFFGLDGTPTAARARRGADSIVVAAGGASTPGRWRAGGRDTAVGAVGREGAVGAAGTVGTAGVEGAAEGAGAGG